MASSSAQNTAGLIDCSKEPPRPSKKGQTPFQSMSVALRSDFYGCFSERPNGAMKRHLPLRAGVGRRCVPTMSGSNEKQPPWRPLLGGVNRNNSKGPACPFLEGWGDPLYLCMVTLRNSLHEATSWSGLTQWVHSTGPPLLGGASGTL